MAESDTEGGDSFFLDGPPLANSSARIDPISLLGVEYAPFGERPSATASNLDSSLSSTAPGSVKRPAGRVGQELGKDAAIGVPEMVDASQKSNHRRICSILSGQA